MSGMHLLPAYWTTNNTKKRKKKVVSKKEQLAILEHEKFLKRMGVKRSVAQPGSASALGAEGQRFKSSRSDQCFYDPSSAKKEEQVYTGDEIIGIAQMHKSNAVPVRGKKQATEVATMRRN